MNGNQALRLECLQVAARLEKTPEGVLEASKKFYEFVSDQRSSQLEEMLRRTDKVPERV